MSKQRGCNAPSKAQQQAIEAKLNLRWEQKLMIDCFSVLFAATWTMILSTSLCKMKTRQRLSALGIAGMSLFVVESVMKKSVKCVNVLPKKSLANAIIRNKLRRRAIDVGLRKYCLA